MPTQQVRKHQRMTRNGPTTVNMHTRSSNKKLNYFGTTVDSRYPLVMKSRGNRVTYDLTYEGRGNQVNQYFISKPQAEEYARKRGRSVDWVD